MFLLCFCKLFDSLFLNFFPKSFHLFQPSRTLRNSTYLGGSLTVSYNGRRWFPATPFHHPIRVASLTDPTTQNLPKSCDILQKVDLKSITLQSSRSGFSFSLEELPPWASLMAGVFPLGPSDAPCPVGTSTVHGDSFFWATNLITEKDKIYWLSGLALNYNRCLLTPPLRLPEMSTSSISRRPHSSLCSANKKLGFLLLGFSTISGPLSFMRPKPIYDPKETTRFVSRFVLSILSQCLYRYLDLNGRRHQLRDNSLSLLWLYNPIMRILVLVSNMGMRFDSKSLKIYALMFLNLFCRRDHEPPICILKQAATDYKTIVNRILAVVLLPVGLLAPARITALDSSSTSSCLLLTVTILSSSDLFMEDFSTNRDLTCAKVLSSICLKALMESRSI